MNIQLRITWYLVAVPFMNLAIAAPPNTAGAHTEILSALTKVVVRARIVAGAEPLVIPTCGTSDNQEPHLCTLGVGIEVETAHGWVAASLTPDIGSVPGGIPLDRTKAKTIEPGMNAEVRFTFDKQDYVLRAGQHVRLRIDTWSTEDSMRANGPKVSVVTRWFTFQ